MSTQNNIAAIDLARNPAKKQTHYKSKSCKNINNILTFPPPNFFKNQEQLLPLFLLYFLLSLLFPVSSGNLASDVVKA